MHPLAAYRAGGADLPFGNLLRSHPGVRMEGYYWRFTDPASKRVLIALCGVNRADDGQWSTLGLGAHPGGFLLAVEHPEGRADPEALGAYAGQAFRGDAATLAVDLGADARLEVSISNPVAWPRRSLGGSSVFQAVPALNQYWHPWLLGGSARGRATVGGEEWEIDGWCSYAEKNWGKGGFPDSWWWGQAQGFDPDPARDACLAFAGGEIDSGPFSTEVTAVVVRLPGGRLLRLGDPLLSPTTAEVSDDRWHLVARSPRWEVEVLGEAPLAAAHLLPVPLPREKRNVAGALEHLAGRVHVAVRRRRRGIVWEGASDLAALEHGGLELSAREAERRGMPGASAVPPQTTPT